VPANGSAIAGACAVAAAAVTSNVAISCTRGPRKCPPASQSGGV
jgi:hypothetical protein